VAALLAREVPLILRPLQFTTAVFSQKLQVYNFSYDGHRDRARQALYEPNGCLF